MNTYKASFTTGLEITRNSKRTYTHAYAIYNENGAVLFDGTGFSGSKESAMKAAKSVVGFWANTYKTKEEGKNFKAQWQIEIVEVA
jgi:hypothetical protein